MEIKQIVSIEVTKNDQVFSFQMPVGTTWGSALDAAFEVLEKVKSMSDAAVDSLKPQEAPQEPS